jgi:S-DNA-T family DNA segregation ATPase FtsK/SpoIIIE
MFSKRNGNARRRHPPPAPELSPRMARLLRESWWLLVAATFLYLALTLATYTKSDAGWSTTGSGPTIANRGGVAGAWLSDLLLYLFGLSAWWWVAGGVVLVVLGYRRVVQPEREHEHPLVLAAVGFVLVLLSSASLEAIRLWRLPASLPLAPGGALGDAIGDALARGVGFNGATLLLLALFAVGTSLLFGVSWLRVMERIGAGVEALAARVRARGGGGAVPRLGGEKSAERAEAVFELRED